MQQSAGDVEAALARSKPTRPGAPHAPRPRHYDLFSRAMHHGFCQSCCILFWLGILAFAGLACFAVTVKWTRNGDPHTTYTPPFSGVRLPFMTRPSTYTLGVTVDPAGKKFWGAVTINCDIVFPTSYIVLHADPSLQILTFRYGRVGGEMKDFMFKSIPSAQIIFGQVSGVLPTGPWVLYLEFAGPLLAPLLQGLYYSPFTNNLGKSDLIVSTQFEPTDARRMFPCFDEPSYKASFVLTVSTLNGLNVLSNMPLVSTSADPINAGYTLSTFSPTPAISSYLLALAIGKFDYLETTSKSGVTVRAYTVTGLSAQAATALDIAAKALDLFQTRFGIPYFMPKLDVLAVPDFSSSGMENAGLIMMRYDSMLMPTTGATATQYHTVVAMVCHEVAHQWFGDLVTMAWWNDLWLSEGVAHYFEYWCADSIFPLWDMWNVFPNVELPRAFSQGAHVGAHALSAGTSSMDPDLIPGLFDATTYAKGAAFLRMTKAVLEAISSSSTTFDTAMTNYLTTYSLQTASSADFGRAINKLTKYDFTTYMNSWINKPGFPVVSISWTPDTSNAANMIVTVSQTRFLIVPPTTPDRTVWTYPLAISSGGAATVRMISNAIIGFSVANPVHPTCAACKWYLANTNRLGYFRSNYTTDVWLSFADAISTMPSALSATDRATLLDDASAFFFASQLPVDSHMRLLRAMLAQETSVFGWMAIERVVDNLLGAARDAAVDLASVQAFISRGLTPILAVTGTSFAPALADPTGASSGLDEQLRVIVLSIGLKVNHPVVVANALAAYNASLYAPNVIDASLVQHVLDAYVQSCDACWSTIETRYLAAHVAGDDASALQFILALASSRVTGLLRNTASYLIRYDIVGQLYVKPQDFPNVLSKLADNLYGGRDVASEYLRNNWVTIRDTYATGGFGWDQIILSAFGDYDTTDQLTAVQTFLNANPAPYSSTAIATVTDDIQGQINFKTAMYVPTMSWIATNG